MSISPPQGCCALRPAPVPALPRALWTWVGKRKRCCSPVCFVFLQAGAAAVQSRNVLCVLADEGSVEVQKNQTCQKIIGNAPLLTAASRSCRPSNETPTTRKVSGSVACSAARRASPGGGALGGYLIALLPPSSSWPALGACCGATPPAAAATPAAAPLASPLGADVLMRFC